MVSPDATLADVVQALATHEEFVRRVLSNMADFRREHGDVVVRLGVTGDGRRPNYRLQVNMNELNDLEESTDRAHFLAFRGSNHQEFTWTGDELQRQSWSSRAMTFEEVQQLLGTIRSSRRR